MAKLKRYGLDDIALKWFFSYLSDRKQYVVLNRHSSSLSKIHLGVHQGSIVGPLLFLISVNDLAVSCHHLTPILFADDTNLIAVHSDFLKLVQCVNTELLSVSNWFQCNKLTLNIKKCNFVIFCHANTSYPKEQAKISINEF